MTVQNKMAVLMMSGGLGELVAADKSSTASKTPKTDSFNEVFKTADRSYAETDRVEKSKLVQGTKDVSIKEDGTENVEMNEREQLLERAFEKVISDEKEVFVEEEIVLTDEVMALLQTLVQNVSEQLQEILGMSEELLNLAVDELGMTDMDLLNPNSIMELVVRVKADGDFTELISNEELHNQVTSLFNMLDTEIADLANELGLTTEQFEQFIDTALAVDNVADDVAPANEQSDGVITAEQSTQETSQIITVDKSENREMSQNDTSQKDASQNSETLFGEVMNKLEQSIAATTATTEEPQAVQIVRQVIEQIQIRAREDMTSMEIQLTPENLGKVNLQVTAKDGAVTAQITTETLMAKEAIEAQINILRENLNEQGIKVEAVEVTVESHKFEADSEQNKGTQHEESNTRRRFIDLDNIEEGQFEDTAAVLAREIMMSNGNRMDIIT